MTCRYFIVVDDLWTSSVWDIISRAFPYDDCCSRILATTQVEDVALACSGYETEYILKMGRLNDGESRKLFFSYVFGSEGEGACPKEFKVVADRIISKCGGLPLSTVNIASLLLPRMRSPAVEQWEKVESSLPSTLRTDPTSQGIKDVLILIYNELPLHLKACLLYLSMYPEGYSIRKDDLVKQWVAESLVSGIEYGYFNELVRRGMIKPVDTKYDGEVLSCTANHMVLDLIRYKSVEDNFIIAVNYFESTLRLPDKVRRLSVQFGGAKSAKIPESIRMSQVRSLLFCGPSRCVPSVLDYCLLRVLILHILADQDQMSFDFSRVGELFRLRYLMVECNITINLPDKIQGLEYLETLQLDGRLSAVPSDIGHLENLRHLRLPSQANVRDLGGLTNLQDLHLTLSIAQPVDHLEDTMNHLGSILDKLSNLQSLILASAGSSPVNTSSVSISCDGLSNVFPALAHLERLELLPRICIFPSLPKWFKTLDRLGSLKVGVRELSNSDTDIVKGLPSLTALSLYIQTAPAETIVFGNDGFSALKYFKLRCSEPLLKFEAGAMPNLRKLKLVFNAQEVQQHAVAPICIEHLAGLKEISAKIWGAGAAATESALRISVINDPKNPKINKQQVNWNFYTDEYTIMGTSEPAAVIVEERGEILEENTEYEYTGEDGNRQPDKDRIMGTSESTSVIVEEERDEILEENSEYEYSGDDGNRQPDKDRIMGTSESTSMIVEEERGEILEENSEYECSEEEGNRQPDKDRIMGTSESTAVNVEEERGEILEENSEYEYSGEDGKIQADKDRIMRTSESTAVNVEEERDEILEENSEYEYTGEDGNRQPDWYISMLRSLAEESSSRALPRRHTSPPLPWIRPSPRSPWRRHDRRCCQTLLSVLARTRRAVKAGWTAFKAAYEVRDDLLWWDNLAQCNAGELCMAAVQANNLMEDHCRVESSRTLGTCIGIFDGHGGPEAARFTADNLVRRLQFGARYSLRGMTDDIIREAFLDIEASFIELVSRQWLGKPTLAAVGTCCLVGIVHHRTLFVGNLGDSRAVLGKVGFGGQITMEQLTNEHNVRHESVRQELRARHPNDPDIVVPIDNVWSVKGKIQVSRSIGDAYLKHQQFNWEPLPSMFRLGEPFSRPILSANPSIISRRFQPSDRFIIFASAGLWEFLSNEEAIEIVHRNEPTLAAGKLIEAAVQKAGKKPEALSKHLKKTERGARRRFHDDITVVVLFLDHFLLEFDEQRRHPPFSIRCPLGNTLDMDNFMHLSDDD
ncbi:disease resistance protein RGA5 isoform X1 [Aegilops tauschii subsp. strangulata]|uniref:disease resistance protein RGA5 isoform X1 n=1 Tax=Aegilops tauschii subsp. strangulata TaxID=200361 RepID=UPI00098ABBBC